MTTTVTAAAVSKNFDAYQDAAVRVPVIITKNGRPRTVLLAYVDFARLSKRDRRVELTAEFSADEIAAVEAAEMEPGLDHLNGELPPAKVGQQKMLPAEIKVGHVFRYSSLWHGNTARGAKKPTRTRHAWC